MSVKHRLVKSTFNSWRRKYRFNFFMRPTEADEVLQSVSQICARYKEVKVAQYLLFMFSPIKISWTVEGIKKLLFTFTCCFLSNPALK